MVHVSSGFALFLNMRFCKLSGNFMVFRKFYVHGNLTSKEHEIAHNAPVCKNECHFCRQGIANK